MHYIYGFPSKTSMLPFLQVITLFTSFFSVISPNDMNKDRDKNRNTTYVAVQRSYKWRPSLPDWRDEYFHRTSINNTNDNCSYNIDLRAGFPPVYDQQNLGACTSFAIGAAIQYDELRQFNHSDLPSFLFIYYNERQLEGHVNTDSGASLRDGIKVIAKQGYSTATLWPYVVSNFKIRPPVEAYMEAVKHRAIQYRRVSQTLEDIKAVLAAGFPIVFGITVYESFESEKVAATGHVPMPSKNEQILGGHALVLVGALDDTKEFIVRNSWSNTFGDNGYIYLPYDYVTNSDLASDFWVVQRVSSVSVTTSIMVSSMPLTYSQMLYI